MNRDPSGRITLMVVGEILYQGSLFFKNKMQNTVICFPQSSRAAQYLHRGHAILNPDSPPLAPLLTNQVKRGSGSRIKFSSVITLCPHGLWSSLD